MTTSKTLGFQPRLGIRTRVLLSLTEVKGSDQLGWGKRSFRWGDEGGEGQGGYVGMDGDGGESTSISSASSSISMSMDTACVVGGIPCPCNMGGGRGIDQSHASASCSTGGGKAQYRVVSGLTKEGT